MIPFGEPNPNVNEHVLTSKHRKIKMLSDNTEIIFVSADSNQKLSLTTYDTSNGNVLHSYRNGGIVAEKSLCVLGNDYVLSAEKGKPLLHVWALNSEDEVKNPRLVLPEPANVLAVSPDCCFLAAGIGAKLYVWLLSTGKLLSVTQKHYQSLTCIKFASDGSILIVAGQDGIITAYRVADLVNVQSTLMPQSTLGAVEPLYQRLDHGQPVTDLHVGAFGFKSRFASVSSDQTLRIYNLLRGNLLLTVITDTPLTAVTFDSPCWNVYVGSISGDVRKYNLREPPRGVEHHETSEDRLSFVGHAGQVTCLNLNMSGTCLASGSEDCTVLLWDTSTRQILRKIAQKGAVRNVLFAVSAENMMNGKFAPEVVFHALERTVSAEDDFTAVVMQREELGEKNEEGKEKKCERTRAEMERLRIVNRQMYDLCLRLTEKLYD